MPRSTARARLLSTSFLAFAWASLAAFPEEPVLGVRAGFDLSSEAEETISVAAGSRLRDRPDLRAVEILSIPEELELPVVERRPPWVRVRYGDLRGWLLVRGGGPAKEGAVAAPAVPPFDSQALARARAVLGAEAREETLGAFRLLTDLEAGKLLAALGAIARSLPAAYAERFGLPVAAPGEEAVLLFASLEGYRRFAEGEPDLARLEPSGHAGNGIAALAAEAKDRDALQALLVHELTHLLNRRALGLAVDLAPWLDEGLAEDLAYSQIDSSGRLKLGSLAGRTRTTNEVGGVVGKLAGDSFVTTTTGPRALLLELLERWPEPERPALVELLDLSWSELADPGRRSLLYPQSGFFVRFLLDADGGRSAPAFHAFLRTAAAGGDSDAGAVLAALGIGEAELEERFLAWLRAQAGVVEPPRR